MAEEIKVDQTLDVRGILCPRPMLMTMNHLKKMQKGQVLLVLATDRATKQSITSLCKKTGDELLKQEDEATVLKYWIRKAR